MNSPPATASASGPRSRARSTRTTRTLCTFPGEYELDGYVFYRKKTWDVQVNVKNITNERLLDPVDVTFAGNDAIYVRPPITTSITLRYHF